VKTANPPVKEQYILKSGDYLSQTRDVLARLDHGLIDRIAESIWQAYQRGRTVYLFGNGGSASLASHLACDLGKGTMADGQRRLRAVRDTMDADLRRPWKISELARQAGISRRSFNTHFRRAFGMSASQYLRIRRLESARDALVHQGVSVNDAAYLAGYNNPANFATAFRRRFGHAPSRYRSQQD